jgi:hypothetical protein
MFLRFEFYSRIMENEPLFDEDDVDQLFVTLKQMNDHLEVMRRIIVIQFGIFATIFTLGILSAVIAGAQ